MGQQEIEAYLNYLASTRHVSASTQSSALNAIAFLYKKVLKGDMPELTQLRRIKRHVTLPVVMSIREVQQTIIRMNGTTRLMAELIYGTGLRINECMTLRVKDVDFDLNTITVRAAKGNKDRVTLLPQSIVSTFRQHLLKVAQLHTADKLKGAGHVPMPNALYKKYPSASQSLAWQYVFPSSLSRPWHEMGKHVRWHASPSTLRRAFKRAASRYHQTCITPYTQA